MRDWSDMVRSRLNTIGPDPSREEEIRAELAGHLEDVYEHAKQCGCSEGEAVARALERVPDWTHLGHTIRRANQEGALMSHDTKTLWLPGMAALCCAAALVLGITWLAPPEKWADPRLGAQWLAAAIAISCYVAFGALGASWSRRAGGRASTRFLAGVFPLALHVAMVILAMGLDFQLGVVLKGVVIPGIALAVGTFPFLREDERSRELAR